MSIDPSREPRIGIIGAGYWGAKLARNVVEADGASLVAICDADADRRDAIATRYPGVVVVARIEDMLALPGLDAAIVATPASQHAAQAAACIEAGLDVLVEKPLALTTADCDALIALADGAGRILAVGHTFLYSEPVRMLRAIVAAGELGSVRYLASQRLNLGAIRPDASAMWDLAPHDVSIMLHLLDGLPEAVSARQFGFAGADTTDVAFLTLEFPGGVVAHVHDSRLDPRKVRQLTVVGERKMAVYDDTDVEAPLRVYDAGVDRISARASGRARHRDLGEGFGEFRFEVRTGDLWIPKVTACEPLRTEIERFADAVRTRVPPLTDGHHGRCVVAVLEAAETSSAAGGIPVATVGGASGAHHAA